MVGEETIKGESRRAPSKIVAARSLHRFFRRRAGDWFPDALGRRRMTKNGPGATRERKSTRRRRRRRRSAGGVENRCCEKIGHAESNRRPVLFNKSSARLTGIKRPELPFVFSSGASEFVACGVEAESATGVGLFSLEGGGVLFSSFLRGVKRDEGGKERRRRFAMSHHFHAAPSPTTAPLPLFFFRCLEIFNAATFV